MTYQGNHIRVLYSFPHQLGAERICYTAWQQVNGLALAGADVLVCPGALRRPVAPEVSVWPTLAKGRLRIPYKLIGSNRAFALHDAIVSRRLERLAGKVDIVHAWPLGALQTLKTASRLGIPTVLERPNAHTEFAMEVVRRECDRLGVCLPADHEHAQNAKKLLKEEEEYRWADRLLCPSEFVLATFRDKGFPMSKLIRHQYGFDEGVYFPDNKKPDGKRRFTMLFAGGCAPRKGVHYALEAWLQSPAHRDGKFLIAGEFLPAYANKLSKMMADPSVNILGHRNDLPELMRRSDVLILPSVEEGSALVTSEARGSGCVLLVSQASGATCEHLKNALVHNPGDVGALSRHITMLYEDHELLLRLREESIRTMHEITWSAAGRKLLQVYQDVVASGRDTGVPVLCA